MRSAEYLRAVEEALQGYDDEMVKELLLSLNEHFEQGLSEGRSEEELCLELGPVENLIKELNAMGENANQKEKALEYQIEPVTSLVKHNNPDAYPVSKIHAELGFADVCLISTDSPVPYIRLQSGSDRPEQYRLEEYCEGDTYVVKLIKNEKVQPAPNRSFFEQLFSGVVKGLEAIGIHLALKLYIPEDIKEVYIKQSSGDVEGEKLSVPDLKILTSSGEINIEHIHSDILETGSVSGDINLDNIDGGQMSAHSTSGDIYIDSGNADDQINVNTTSGDIEINGSQANKIKINTISGDITGEISCAEVFACSTSGDLDLTLLQDGNAKLNTVSGDVSVSLQNLKRGFCADTHTVSGDVRVRYGGENGHYGKNAVIRIGGETSKLEIHTVSGDIKIGE